MVMVIVMVIAQPGAKGDRRRQKKNILIGIR